ncbi:MAG: GAF domain-containing protein [bacterium]
MALQRTGMAMASTLKPSEIVRLVLSEVVKLAKADSAIVYLNDDFAHRLVPKYSLGVPLTAHPLDLVSSDDLAVQVAHTGKLQQMRINAECHREEGCEKFEEARFCRLVIPLVAGDETLGVIDVRAQRCRLYDHKMEKLLGALASQAAQVFRNASIHEELEQHYRELSLLYEIQQEVSSTLEYQNVLKLIVERTRKLLGARECTIRLIVEREGRKYIRIAATTGKHYIGPEEALFDEDFFDHKVMSGEMAVIEDMHTDPDFPWRQEAIEAGVVSMLCAPLVAHRRIIGTIRLYTADRREFSVSDRKMLLAVAGLAATAIENVSLYRQIESKNRQLLESYEALRDTQKELVRKERLAALGEMAATVAHEIRNPLTSVRGFAQRIARRYAKVADKRLGEYTGIIIEEVDRLNKFINDVLDFSRHVKPNFDKVNINEALSEILHLMAEELAGQNIILIPDLDMKLKETIVDAGQIKQMFLNILQNARHAMGKKGILMIKTTNVGRYVRIRIADDGHGIQHDTLQKIWSPFFTTKAHGTGLGLSLVQRIIEDHHGWIAIRSRPGRGTIVNIFIPIVTSRDELKHIA